MCGIAGILDHRAGASVSETLLHRMNAAQAHRGPNGAGTFVDRAVGMGHVRLAILDLSEAGRQPFVSDDGNLVISYNGEIFNFLELRLELERLCRRFRSRTDTEVVLQAFDEWGVDSFARLNGMFALAIWNRRDNSITLVRDRFGVKPLYVYHRAGLFLFASEIKAILSHPDVSPTLSPEALGEYFTFQNLFTDLTLFDGVRLLPPGTIMRVDETGRTTERRFWEFRFPERTFDGSFEEAADETERLFQQAVTRQLVSDVPVGAYLSGGMDSGSITSVAARRLKRICTFTCGFDLSSASGLEMGFDERPASEAMANLFKTEHYEIVLHAGDMENVLPSLIWHLEDLRVGQCYPNYYVARLASKFVRVVLSGAGGDELFAGYPWRYFRGADHSEAGNYARDYFQYWQRLIGEEDRPRFFRPEWLARMQRHSPQEVFSSVFHACDVRLDNPENRINASLLFELKTFLHGLLVVEDKLSMAHGLETRVPFLDNDLVDFALSVPVRYKLRDLKASPRIDEHAAGKKLEFRHLASSEGKAVLREAMSRIVPDEVRQRAKQGFSAPDASWFRGESIHYVSCLLRDPNARLFEYLEFAYVQNVLDEHTSGRVNRRLLIWSLLSFELWLRTFLPR